MNLWLRQPLKATALNKNQQGLVDLIISDLPTPDVLFVLGIGVDCILGLPLLNTLFHDLMSLPRRRSSRPIEGTAQAWLRFALSVNRSTKYPGVY